MGSILFCSSLVQFFKMRVAAPNLFNDQLLCLQSNLKNTAPASQTSGDPVSHDILRSLINKALSKTYYDCSLII